MATAGEMNGSGTGSPSADATTPVKSPVPVGRIKAPPSCVASLQREGVSSNDLSKLCFSPDEVMVAVAEPSAKVNGSAGAAAGSAPPPAAAAGAAAVTASSSDEQSSVPPSAAATCSSSSSTSSHEHGSHPELGAAAAAGTAAVPAGRPSATPVHHRTVSRTGRETQRWATDPSTGQLIRLTTGCVPIMKDGRILFCSSSRKEAWILPKGGWESDETLEESALRETFEEAGVLGTLGPVLSDIEYETRKAKKRRLERESMIKTLREEQQRRASSACASSEDEHHGGGGGGAQRPQQPIDVSYPLAPPAHAANGHASVVTAASESAEVKSNDDGSMSPPVTCTGTASKPVFRIQQLQQLQQQQQQQSGSQHQSHHDDAASVASMASMASDVSTSCTHARMKLFPLYVSEVKDDWPESGRAGKVLDIDVAIAMMESRPEFQKALVEVKERGLHLLGPSKDANKKANGR